MPAPSARQLVSRSQSEQTGGRLDPGHEVPLGTLACGDVGGKWATLFATSDSEE